MRIAAARRIDQFALISALGAFVQENFSVCRTAREKIPIRTISCAMGKTSVLLELELIENVKTVISFKIVKSINQNIFNCLKISFEFERRSFVNRDCIIFRGGNNPERTSRTEIHGIDSFALPGHISVARSSIKQKNVTESETK